MKTRSIISILTIVMILTLSNEANALYSKRQIRKSRNHWTCHRHARTHCGNAPIVDISRFPIAYGMCGIGLHCKQ